MLIEINKLDRDKVVDLLDANNVFYNIDSEAFDNLYSDKAEELIRKYSKSIGANLDNTKYYLTRKENLAELLNESIVLSDDDLLFRLTKEFLEDDEMVVDLSEYSNIKILIDELKSDNVEYPVIYNTIMNNLNEVIKYSEFAIPQLELLLCIEVNDLGFPKDNVRKIFRGIVLDEAV